MTRDENRPRAILPEERVLSFDLVFHELILDLY